MAKNIYHVNSKYSWVSCLYCRHAKFKRHLDFILHLKNYHCTQEGGSFVCQYGYRGICSSMLVEIVGDRDYEDHVYRHHMFSQMGCASSSAVSRNRERQQFLSESHLREHPSLNVHADGQRWTLYSASQNLSAVLNDPNRGKQKNFFTKTWGDSFVDNNEIKCFSYLPEIQLQHFDVCRNRMASIYEKHQSLNANSKPSSYNELLQHFPILKASKVFHKCQATFDLSYIPKIFLQQHLDLSDPQTFSAVFPFSVEAFSRDYGGSGDGKAIKSAKLLQEKLSHYMDEVEVQISQQVAYRSDAFFHAMTSHDVLSEKLMQTVRVVKALRRKIKIIDKSLVTDSLHILQLERLHCNCKLVAYKINLIATVHQTQPTIQLLLSTHDYVAALELISTTQEILLQELAGIHSCRYLGSQLLEMEKLINKMLTSEFDRYTSEDLNRSLTDDQQVTGIDKLVSIVFGMLKQKHFQYLDTYKEKVYFIIKSVVKGDSKLIQLYQRDPKQSLSFNDWLELLMNTTSTLMQLLFRVKVLHDIMRQIVDICAGKKQAISLKNYSGNRTDEIKISIETGSGGIILSEEEYQRICIKLRDLLSSVCDFAHERVAHLITTTDQSSISQCTSSLMQKVTASDVNDLSKAIDTFTENCEKVSGRMSTALKSAFQIQVSKFIQKFHQDRKKKLNFFLLNEQWKQVEVPAQFQDLVDHIIETGTFSLVKRKGESDEIRKSSSFLIVCEDKFAVVATMLLLLKIVAEYCSCAQELAMMASNLCHYLAELNQFFNVKCSQLILGAGALRVAGLKTITSTNLALTSRSLQLLLWLIPHVKTHFKGLMENQYASYHACRSLRALDNVEKNIQSHIQELNGKILSIMINLVVNQIDLWEARPPVPSPAFKNISRLVSKLHEAVASILPETQVQNIYKSVHKAFKTKLREQLLKVNIVNNGGPQHGVVTAELTFYLEALRALKVLPSEELEDESMNEIWDMR